MSNAPIFGLFFQFPWEMIKLFSNKALPESHSWDRDRPAPAFNETDAQCEDGRNAYKSSPTCSPGSTRCGRIFHKAWCEGMSEKLLDVNVECYAAQSSR
jgi:hypothetical protein